MIGSINKLKPIVDMLITFVKKSTKMLVVLTEVNLSILLAICVAVEVSMVEFSGVIGVS